MLQLLYNASSFVLVTYVMIILIDWISSLYIILSVHLHLAHKGSNVRQIDPM